MMVLHVAFKVGDGEYVLAASEVVQMESFTRATAVPGAAPYVAGLIQVRGHVLPVIDLRARFGLPPIARTLDSRVVVVRFGERVVGLLADSAREVLRIAPDAFQPPPSIISEQSQGFVTAVAQVGARLVMRIDFAQIIGIDALPQEQTHGQENEEHQRHDAQNQRQNA